MKWKAPINVLVNVAPCPGFFFSCMLRTLMGGFHFMMSVGIKFGFEKHTNIQNDNKLISQRWAKTSFWIYVIRLSEFNDVIFSISIT